tara:strand:+ start:6073 stop:6789 length:717 start_codon:yes stop_codon:yes gene_type:complete
LKSITFFFTICYLITYGTFAQKNINTEVYKSYDSLVGNFNKELYNGTEFTDLYLNTDGSFRYLNGFSYTSGSVTYKGAYYPDVLLRYDLLEDNLIVKSNDNLSVFNVKLIPQFIDSFSLYNYNFVRLPLTNLGLKGNSFFQSAYQGKTLELYIKHVKKKKDKALPSGLQYRFKEEYNFILKYNATYHLINSERELRRLFPHQKEEIKTFYRTYKILRKSNPSQFKINLIKYLDEKTSK